MLRFLLVAAAIGMAGTEALAGDPPGGLAGKSVADWRDLIKPKTDEVCFKSVNWLPTFWDGVTTAQKEDKPILLWVMNGHPLACT